MKSCDRKSCAREIKGPAVAIQAVKEGAAYNKPSGRLVAAGKKLYFCSLTCASAELFTTPPTKALAKVQEMPE